MKKVIVVGSGILGASTAYQLAKHGAEVIIVDRKDIGQATDALPVSSVHGCHSDVIRTGISSPRLVRGSILAS